jgi:hypothetical protein
MTVAWNLTMAKQDPAPLPTADGAARAEQTNLIEDTKALPGRAATNSAPVTPACALGCVWMRGARTLEFVVMRSQLLPEGPRSNTVMMVPAVTHNVLLLLARVIVADRSAQWAAAVAGAGTTDAAAVDAVTEAPPAAAIVRMHVVRTAVDQRILLIRTSLLPHPGHRRIAPTELRPSFNAAGWT